MSTKRSSANVIPSASAVLSASRRRAAARSGSSTTAGERVTRRGAICDRPEVVVAAHGLLEMRARRRPVAERRREHPERQRRRARGVAPACDRHDAVGVRREARIHLAAAAASPSRAASVPRTDVMYSHWASSEAVLRPSTPRSSRRRAPRDRRRRTSGFRAPRPTPRVPGSARRASACWRCRRGCPAPGRR